MDTDAPPFRYDARLANQMELRWQDRWERDGTFQAANCRRAVRDRHRPAPGRHRPADEEVTDEGRSAVGNFPVHRRPLRQWMLRITAFAERLLADLDGVDWPEHVKRLQRNWIGPSGGPSHLKDWLFSGNATGASRSPSCTTTPAARWRCRRRCCR